MKGVSAKRLSCGHERALRNSHLQKKNKEERQDRSSNPRHDIGVQILADANVTLRLGEVSRIPVASPPLKFARDNTSA